MSLIARRRSAVSTPARKLSVLKSRSSGCVKSTRSVDPSRGLKPDKPPSCVERRPLHVRKYELPCQGVSCRTEPDREIALLVMSCVPWVKSCGTDFEERLLVVA